MAEIDTAVMGITMIDAAPVSQESHMTKGYYRTVVLLMAWTIATPGTSTLLAADADRAAAPSTISHLTLDGKPLTALGVIGGYDTPAPLDSVAVPATSASSQRGRRGGRRNSGAATAIFLGAVGTIAGAAVLVYANRPDCDRNPSPGGCGYGTKVAGGAVLSAGLVGLIVGALTWR